MIFQILIDKEKEESCVVIAHQITDKILEIEKLVKGEEFDFVGYIDEHIVKLNVDDIVCFFVENNKIYAYQNDEKYYIKQRLYNIEEKLNSNFIKINQSCLANIKKIKRFSVSFNGALLVEFNNGYKDYVSRRELKNVKRRLGL